MKRAASACTLGLVLTAGLVEAHKPTTTHFTYHRDILPIFESRCGSCHRSGGVAPMSLLNYEDAFPWAVSIKNRVLALSMPPWFADERHGSFRHTSALTAGELNTIVDWCLGGTPEGEPADARAAIRGPSGQSLEEPDRVLELPEPFVLQADQAEARHEATFSRGFDRDRFLKAVELHPQSANVVRSALVFVVPKGGRLAAVQPIASWLPGQATETWPSGLGIRIPAGSSVVLRLHYEKTWLDEGKAVSDRSRVALYFQKKASKPVETVVIAPETGESIRASDSGFEKVVVRPVSGRIEILALLPRVEAPLDSLLAEALFPDGTARALIRLRWPEPDWPRKFWLEAPLSLPEGTRIRLTLEAPEEESLRAAHALVLDAVRE